MPVMIELKLKASWSLRPGPRQLHGLACALFESEDAAHLGQDKPFTVWPLSPAPSAADSEWTWRAAWLPDTPVPAAAVTTDLLRVGHVSCVVLESRQRRVTRAALASGAAVQRVTVSFASPTYFSHNDADTALPDPRLIVGSWRRRWNCSLPAGDPLVISDDLWRDAHRLVHLAAFDLRTEESDTGHGRTRAGFVGTATLRLARGAPRSARTVLGTLSRFAEYCGTGAQTTHGFGATTLVT